MNGDLKMIDISQKSAELPSAVTSVSVIAGESVAGYSEDSHAYAVGGNFGYTAVFDGCGISGSAIYPCFGNQTGSYISANIAACAAVDLFATIRDVKELPVPKSLAKEYKELTDDYLSQFCEVAGVEVPTDGTRVFPTSAAITYFDFSEKNSLSCTCLWAGNCRSYILDKKGLAVLTADDIPDGADVTDGDDTQLTNCIRAGGDYVINRKQISSDLPAMVINATSGCYRAFSNPAELEFMLLYTLDKAKSLSKWEASVDNYMKNVVKDDFTLAVSMFGFSSFDDIKIYFRKRMDDLLVTVIDPLKNFESLDKKSEILGDYISGYERYTD